jgi:ABC-2 type transport system ATP-binding protein
MVSSINERTNIKVRFTSLLIATLLASCGGGSGGGGASDLLIDAPGNAPAIIDFDQDGIANEIDQCQGTAPGAAVDNTGCAPSQIPVAPCSVASETVVGNTYQVTLETYDGLPLSFYVLEPTSGVECSRAALGKHPLMLHGPGYSATAATSGFEDYRADGYTVISWDPRGYGDTGGTVRVMDPEFEGQYLVQILDWAESNLEYLSWHNSNGDFIGRPENGKSVAGGDNLLVGAMGSSYGGGYQLLTLVSDDKKRLDAIAPDITWHDLRNSLNPGDTVKTLWDLALVGLGTSSGYQSLLDNPVLPTEDGQDPFIQETVVRGVTLNEFPRTGLDWFAYKGGFGAWCKASGLPSLPYIEYTTDQIPMLSAETNYGNTPALDSEKVFTYGRELINGRAFLQEPEDTSRDFDGVKVLLTQGMIDTLFNFNEAWWNKQCLEASGADVSLYTHNTGHALPPVQAPDELPKDVGTCPLGVSALTGEADQKAWFDDVLKAQDTFATRDICFALGAEDDLLYLNTDEVIAPGAHESGYSTYDVVPELPVPNGLTGIGNVSGNLGVSAPLFNVTEEMILAGIPQIDLTISSPTGANEQFCDSMGDNSSGCDSITFVGVGVQVDGVPNFSLVDDQILPLRGLGQHSVDLVGIAERLQPGDQVSLLFFATHPQFFGSASRDLSLPTVDISGTVNLPLYRVVEDGVVPVAVSQ